MHAEILPSIQQNAHKHVAFHDKLGAKLLMVKFAGLE
jgi:hypothetical protein